MKQRNAPPVDRDIILSRALDIVDADGLNAFSLAKVAAAVGITVPSLYYYYADKADLLRALSNMLLAKVEKSIPRRRGDWRDVLISICVDARRAMLKHPKAAPLLLLYPPRHVVLEGYERSLRMMEKAGVPADRRLQIALALENLTWGSILISSGSLARGVSSFAPHDPADYPALTRAREASAKGEEELFVSDCRAYLAGIVGS